MLNIYYEISPAIVDRVGGKYFVQQNVHVELGEASSIYLSYNRPLMQYSDRAWLEDDEGVRFLKNRFVDISAPVDSTEFIWMKLSAKESESCIVWP